MKSASIVCELASYVAEILMKIVPWFNIAKPVWITLVIGYIWILISYFLNFEVPSSGAILLCCCLIAELIFNRQSWRKAANSFIFEEASIETNGNGDYIVGGILVSGAAGLDKLFAVATPKHISREANSWIIGQVNNHVEKVVYTFITVSAIVGSLLWAYGHLVFS